MEMQLPKGTFDILPYGEDEAWKTSFQWQFLEEMAREFAEKFGYREIRTPIYERLELFQRGVGASSDIVTKEMFTFEDRAQRKLCLRPEGTSSVMRAFIEHRLQNLGASHKLFYIGPMFRYERPQAGRYRQHHQFGVEAVGVDGPEIDVEVIDLLYSLYEALGLKNLKVQLNSVGDVETRTSFRKELLSSLKPHLSSLSDESKVRFEKNPLRILDSKDPKDREILKGAPSILEYLTPHAKKHFEEVQNLLKQIAIPFEINPKIVRGLDYYQKTVFEITTEDLGAQNAIGAGGRYDGLLASLGGPDLAGVGFATGMERILQTLLSQKGALKEPSQLTVYFIPLGEKAKKMAFSLMTACRRENISADMELQAKKMQTALQNADRKKAKFAAILGDEEIEKNTLVIKHLDERVQKEIPLSDCIVHLKKSENALK